MGDLVRSGGNKWKGGVSTEEDRGLLDLNSKPEEKRGKETKKVKHDDRDRFQREKSLTKNRKKGKGDEPSSNHSR